MSRSPIRRVARRRAQSFSPRQTATSAPKPPFYVAWQTKKSNSTEIPKCLAKAQKNLAKRKLGRAPEPLKLKMLLFRERKRQEQSKKKRGEGEKGEKTKTKPRERLDLGPGYFAHEVLFEDAALSAVRLVACAPLRCPQRALGTCPERQTGLACSRCEVRRGGNGLGVGKTSGRSKQGGFLEGGKKEGGADGFCEEKDAPGLAC